MTVLDVLTYMWHFHHQRRGFVDCSHRIYDNTMVCPYRWKISKTLLLVDKDGAARQSRKTAVDFGAASKISFIFQSHRSNQRFTGARLDSASTIRVPLPFCNIASESMQNSGNERSATRHEAKEVATENQVVAAARVARFEMRLTTMTTTTRTKETATQLAREIETLMSIANAVELPMTMRHASWLENYRIPCIMSCCLPHEVSGFCFSTVRWYIPWAVTADPIWFPNTLSSTWLNRCYLLLCRLNEDPSIANDDGNCAAQEARTLLLCCLK